MPDTLLPAAGSWLDIIGQCQRGGAFAIYRFPHSVRARAVIQHSPRPICLPHVSLLAGMPAAYVAAPFHPRADQPVLLIRPDVFLSALLPHETPSEAYGLLTCNANPDVYFSAFDDFMNLLQGGSCQKLVLARDEQLTTARDIDPFDLFRRASAAYPDAFVALWHTAISGTWLTAMPELLLGRCAGGWKTMALAGTMPYSADSAHPSLRAWSAKNREEQACVSHYIRRILHRHGIRFDACGPHPQNAGRLVHLCTDFRFNLPSPEAAIRLLADLHPTPAVCGHPLSVTLRHILLHEGIQRRYYAGFNGPWQLEDSSAFYVTLRCLHLTGSRQARLYAGGGIVPASRAADEWQETVRKMQTMKTLLFSAPHS